MGRNTTYSLIVTMVTCPSMYLSLVLEEVTIGRAVTIIVPVEEVYIFFLKKRLTIATAVFYSHFLAGRAVSGCSSAEYSESFTFEKEAQVDFIAVSYA